MPNRTIWVRVEDLDIWEGLGDTRPDWLHERLQEEADPSKRRTLVEKGWKQCPNGHAIPAGKTKCLGKSCKYS